MVGKTQKAAALDVTTTAKSLESSPSSWGDKGISGKPRQLVVNGDVIFRRTDSL